MMLGGVHLNYISISEAAEKWGLTKRRIQELCKTERINGAVRFGRAWMIPAKTEKPYDGRFKTSKTASEKTPSGFLIPAPKENPFLLHTDIYSTPGSAESVIESFKEYPETQLIVSSQFHYRSGDVESIYKNIDHFLEQHVGFYSTISTGILLSYCAIFKGDISLWRKAKKHIYSAPCKTDRELEILSFWTSVIDSKLNDTRNYPEWFSKGKFNILPADSYPTARLYYAKYLFVRANDLAHGKIKLNDVDNLGLMRTLPYVFEPMISQAKIERTVIPEAYLHLMLAVAYHDLGNNAESVPHIDEAIKLCLPDKLYGILTEYRTALGNLLDDRLLLFTSENEVLSIKKLHKSLMAGWTRLHNLLFERNVSNKLTVREREVAKLAAFGLSNTEIAARLNIEISSVKQYIFSAMNKVGAEKRNELGLYL